MDRNAFEQLVERSLERLPKRFKSRLRNILIEIQDQPSEELLAELDVRTGTLFGLYQGVPLTEREWNFGNALPDRITIYRIPIEHAAASDEDREQIVLDTVMHEIGHYFGFDDEALYEIEQRKKRRGKAGR